MDVRRMGRLAVDLDRFLGLFDDCFSRSEGRELLRRYVRGQLSDVRRKCIEPMADALGMPPRTLQGFLTTHTWDWQRALDRLQEVVAQAHLCDESIGLIDETSFPKRGDKTAGVQRQTVALPGRSTTAWSPWDWAMPIYAVDFAARWTIGCSCQSPGPVIEVVVGKRTFPTR